MYRKSGVSFEDIVIDNKIAWFFSSEYNALFELCLQTGNVEYCGSTPYEPFLKQRLFASIKKFNNKIYLIPFTASHFTIYDIETKQFSVLKSDLLISRSVNVHYMASERIGHFIYAFGVFEKKVVKIDCNDLSYKVYDEWLEDVSEFNQTDAFFRNQLVNNNNRLIIPLCNSNSIMEFDIVSEKIRIHKIGHGTVGFSGICYFRNQYWMISRDNSKEITICDENFQKIKQISVVRDKKCNALAICNYDNAVYVFTNNNSEIYSIDCEDIKIPHGKIYFAKTIEDMLLYLEYDNELKIERDNTIVKYKIEIDISKFPVQNLIKKEDIQNEKKILVESELVNLSEYLGYIITI